MLENAIREPKVNPMVSFSKSNIDAEKAARNAEYLAMLDKSLKEIEEGKIVEVSAEEIRRMLNEGVYFSVYEWKVFTEELKLGKSVEIALHNARYYGELKRRIDDTEAGRNTITFSEEEFEAMINQ